MVMWSVIFDVTIAKGLQLTQGSDDGWCFSAMKYFLNQGIHIFLDIILHTLYMYRETGYPYDWLHCDTRFISVIKNQAHNIAEVCL